MAIMVMQFEVDDYDGWKQRFDQDPIGRRAAGATSHIVSRAVDNPNQVFVRVEFPSTEQAQSFRQKLVDSGVFESSGMQMKMGPTVAEIDDATTY